MRALGTTHTETPGVSVPESPHVPKRRTRSGSAPKSPTPESPTVSERMARSGSTPKSPNVSSTPESPGTRALSAWSGRSYSPVDRSTPAPPYSAAHLVEKQEDFLSCVVEQPARVGSRVLALWTDGLYYPGTVVKVRLTVGRAEVAYDDGDINSLPLTHIKVLNADQDPELAPRKRLRREQHERLEEAKRRSAPAPSPPISLSYTGLNDTQKVSRGGRLPHGRHSC